MTRWARAGSTQRHRKMPQDPTPWREFQLQHELVQKHEENPKAETTEVDEKQNYREMKSTNKHDTQNVKNKNIIKRKSKNTDDNEIQKELDDEHCTKNKIKKETDKSVIADAFVDTMVKSGKKSLTIDPELLLKQNRTKKLKKKKSMKLNSKYKEIEIENTDNSSVEETNVNKNIFTDDETQKKKYKVKKMNQKDFTLNSEYEKKKKPKLTKDIQHVIDEEHSNGKELNSSSNLNEETASQERKISLSPQRKKKWIEKVKEKRLKSGILLLPGKIERKLYKIKKSLRDKGMPGEKIKEIIREARRKEELKFRKTLKTCFNCRQTGHILADCPSVLKDVEQGTGICFKCGSSEHTSFKCHLKISDFPFAKCFICKQQGHLSRSCPRNTHGAYPKGGKCNFCGDINHLKKECPKLMKKGHEEEDITADTIDDLTSVDDVTGLKPNKAFITNKPKIIKF